ncbi:hypothetical protein [Paenibacillus tyrfis]|uniref:Uncharacterized protein n=1 Tax=Paenibacillus tyrfis TaxID=1501230 RepID=A0A081P2Z6_9BACL|nr:hypothetical protein [Paenibacillus tyrfis]KEQ25069.1 hypothetical protein ET33_05085 [Paenibacillus tyrfis]
MPSRKQEPAVLSDTAEKTDRNGKLLEGIEAASAETIAAERQQPGTRRKRGAKTTTEAQSTETNGADGDAAVKPRASRRKSAVGARAETSGADSDAAPQPQETPEAAPLAEEAALTVAAAAEPTAEPALPAAVTDTAEDAAPVLQLLETRLKKKERGETHDKDRVFIRKDLKLRLDALAENRGKGFKTLLLNYGLEKALDELEQAEAARQED